MKKKLTVNTLALGNLKQRRKQYTIMIIGIILAMVFSSSIVLFMFSASETFTEQQYHKWGKQSCAEYIPNIKDDNWKDLVEKDFINSYGYMHNVGYAYSDENEKHLGCAVTWMDDKAEELYYLTLLEGRKPTAENEIAIEKTALKKLGYKEAGVGDKINVSLDVANGAEYGNTVKKEYTIVGIYDDRKTINNQEYIGDGNLEYDRFTPAIYVAQGTQVELGGQETLFAIISANKEYGKYYSSKLKETYHGSMAYYGYLSDQGFYTDADPGIVICTGSGYSSYYGSLDALFDGGDYLGIVMAVLVFAACVAIINAFNTNLKERKKQIGLLRAVGTTKRQIINIFGREAFIISLIATPISVAISYVVVRVALTILGGECIMSNSIWALVVSAIVNVIVVMLAALVPLSIASKVTPMQAIRNVDTNRKAKNKKIKSKHSFKPAQHLASRITKFYKGSTIAVSIMLTVTICFSCIAFSFISYSTENILNYSHDYCIRAGYGGFDEVNFENPTGLTETERQDISALPYVGNIYGKKTLSCAIEIDELTSYFKIININDFEVDDDYLTPSSVEDLKDTLENNIPQRYIDAKKELNIQKEKVTTGISAYNKGDIERLSKSSISGKIDYNKLASGEEIVLVAPSKVELTGFITSKGSGYDTLCDDEMGKYSIGYEHIAYGESPFKVGDDITVVIGTYTYDEENDRREIKSVEKKNVKIGAIVKFDRNNDYFKGGVGLNDFELLTTIEGMDNFQKRLPYTRIEFDVNDEINDELDDQIKEEMSVYADKYGGVVESNYWFTNWQNKQTQKMLIGVIALIIIGFAICISIINNSISAQIRENKRVIGTLRAVGADQKELSKSYIYQMLSMFGWGTGVGYSSFLVILGIVKLVTLKTGGNFEFIINPWFTIIMTVIAFALCSFNVFSKIRKEMKNSIVENIREL